MLPAGTVQLEGVTLLVKSRRSISRAIGVRVTKSMCSMSLAFNRRMQDHCSTFCELTNRVCCDAVCANLLYGFE